jgi:predicted nucleotidyltransferase
MFSVQERDRVRDRVLEMASSDARVVAGAVVGSLARDEGDRWSDLDLTFAVADGASVFDVLDDWTGSLVDDFNAVQLFDLPHGATIYRVFLLPGCLQFDLSFTPACEFAPGGPKFRLLFGSAGEKRYPPPPSAHELFGYAVHHALRARFCIERRRFWQAEYWVSGVRDYALGLACLRHGLPAREGRGFDDLPADVRDAFAHALARSIERDELLRSLASAVAGLLREATDVAEVAAKVEGQLRELTSTAL